jgi:hypothetical protein
MLATAAVILLQIAFQSGHLAQVALAGSQFVTVAVVLAVAVDREPIRWRQATGVACTAIAVALLALG